MSKEIGPREKALREMREAKHKRSVAELTIRLLPIPKPLKRKLTKAIDAAAKKRGKARKAKKK